VHHLRPPRILHQRQTLDWLRPALAHEDQVTRRCLPIIGLQSPSVIPRVQWGDSAYREHARDAVRHEHLDGAPPKVGLIGAEITICRNCEIRALECGAFGAHVVLVIPVDMRVVKRPNKFRE
jgi:hypothetical protein